jgi:hypothetical protein
MIPRQEEGGGLKVTSDQLADDDHAHKDGQPYRRPNGTLAGISRGKAMPNRHWVQFSLRGCLALTTAICLWLGWQAEKRYALLRH